MAAGGIVQAIASSSSRQAGPPRAAQRDEVMGFYQGGTGCVNYFLSASLADLNQALVNDAGNLGGWLAGPHTSR